ncbi:MAG: fatty acid desaturase [Chitinophagales bacterium]
MSSIKFEQQQSDSFYRTLNQRVNAYFKDHKKSKHANAFMVFKSILFFGGTLVFYFLFISDWFTFWQLLPIAMLLGLFKALAGVNIGHDAIHGAYSQSKGLNNFLGFTFDLLGINTYTWRISHNVVHHTYTNIPEHDYDIEISAKILRLSPKGIHFPHMRFQQYYAFFLYGLSSISRAFKQEYSKFFSKKIGSYVVPEPPLKQYFHLFFWRFLFYIIFIVVPMMTLSLPWWQVLVLFIAMMFVKGLFLGVVFQLAHIVEKVEYPEPDEEGQLEHTWSAHQLRTTANFSTQNWMANFLCGGLNTQVEHHLFPNICHIHYPNIAPIVAQTAAEFNLPYHEYPTFPTAVRSHFNHLKYLGEGRGQRNPKVAVS